MTRARDEVVPYRTSAPDIPAGKAGRHGLRPLRRRQKSPPAPAEDVERESAGCAAVRVHLAASRRGPVTHCFPDNAPRFLPVSASCAPLLTQQLPPMELRNAETTPIRPAKSNQTLP